MLRKLKNLFHKPTLVQSGEPPEILLLTAPPWGTHNPPTGLAYLSTYLKAHGVKVSVFDANIEFYRRINPENHRLWLPENKKWWATDESFEELRVRFTDQLDWIAHRVVSSKAPVVGFSVVDPKERMTIEIVKRIIKRKPETRIIMGGPAISTPEQRDIFCRRLPGLIDFFVEGPGEAALLEIMKRYRTSGFTANPGRASSPEIVSLPIESLDEIPHPRYDEFDFSLYDGGGFFVEWSRGCISSCAYCKGRHLLGPYRMKKATAILAELDYLYERFGFKHFIVCDNLFNGNTRELEKLCDLLIERSYPFTWEGQAIPYKRMTKSLMEKLKQAGCQKVQWGIESGSDTLLKNVGKGKVFAIEDARQVLQDSHEAGLINEIFIIVGLPGENEAEFQKTMSFFRDNRAYIDVIKSINTLHLVHGTDLFNHASDRFDLELPAEDIWYYDWSSRDGQNNYALRLERAKRLIAFAEELQIPVLENNLYEG
ncbi:MAG: radical SAM protein [Desulfobulbaceae bacterium]|nr:MAG: radical SAM protein [Desulfobulbaceae bacterium]